MAVKVRKKDLMNLIAEHKTKAQGVIGSRCEKEMHEVRLRMLKEKGYYGRLEELVAKVAECSELAKGLAQDMKEDTSIRYQAMCYESPEADLHRHSIWEAELSRLFRRSGINSKELVELENKHSAEYLEVTNTYDSVINALSSFSKTSDAVKYAKELGFDLSSIEREDDIKDLVVPIDISKLHLEIVQGD